MRKTIFVGVFLFLFLFIPFFPVTGELEPSPYTIDGDTVYINDSKAFISATPHTLNRRGPLTATFMTKQFTGDVTLAFGFDNTVLQPRDLRRVTYSTEEVEYSRVCDTKNGTLTFDYTSTENWAYCYLSANGRVVWEHHYDSVFAAQDTIYWLVNVTSETETPISAPPLLYQGVVDGKNRWYYYENVSFVAGVPKTYRVTLDVLRGEGKYDIAAFPSSYGDDFNAAIADGNFYFLDPWWVSSASAVHEFKFNESSGTWVNDSIGTINFSMNAMEWSTDYPVYNDSGNGTAYAGDFDGANNYGLSTDALITADANYSICGWANTTDVSQSGYFLSQMDNVDWNKEDFIIEFEAGGLSVRKRTEDGRSDADRVVFTPPEGRWFQWCFVYDASKGLTLDGHGASDDAYNDGAMSLYVNGTLVDDTVVDQNVNGWTTVETRLGRAVASVEYTGLLDEVTVWDDALNSSDVANLYNLGRPSRDGYLTLADVTPSADGDVTRYEFFEYTVEVTCNFDLCGDVTAYLDPREVVE